MHGGGASGGGSDGGGSNSGYAGRGVDDLITFQSSSCSLRSQLD